jgi:hypothetical protein
MLVRLLGFVTLGCGCVVGRYLDMRTNREVAYVEDKGKTCGTHAHRRNRCVSPPEHPDHLLVSFHTNVA